MQTNLYKYYKSPIVLIIGFFFMVQCCFAQASTGFFEISDSIDNDGMMKGYNLPLIESVREKCSMPITVIGGAGSLHHIKDLINKFKIIGAAAGSLFIFKGKYKAVLINYPNREERKPLYKYETDNTRP